jgi:Protein of unknown function (DUF3421)
VEGGREANGAQLYIARVSYNDGVHTAKIGEHLPGAQLAFTGSEVVINVCTNPNDVFEKRFTDMLAVRCYRTTKCCALTERDEGCNSQRDSVICFLLRLSHTVA